MTVAPDTYRLPAQSAAAAIPGTFITSTITNGSLLEPWIKPRVLRLRIGKPASILSLPSYWQPFAGLHGVAVMLFKHLGEELAELRLTGTTRPKRQEVRNTVSKDAGGKAC